MEEFRRIYLLWSEGLQLVFQLLVKRDGLTDKTRIEKVLDKVLVQLKRRSAALKVALIKGGMDEKTIAKQIYRAAYASKTDANVAAWISTLLVSEKAAEQAIDELLAEDDSSESIFETDTLW